MQANILVELIFDDLFQLILDPIKLVFIRCQVCYEKVSDQLPFPNSLPFSLQLIKDILHAPNVDHILVLNIFLFSHYRLQDHILQKFKLT